MKDRLNMERDAADSSADQPPPRSQRKLTPPPRSIWRDNSSSRYEEEKQEVDPQLDDPRPAPTIWTPEGDDGSSLLAVCTVDNSVGRETYRRPEEPPTEQDENGGAGEDDTILDAEVVLAPKQEEVVLELQVDTQWNRTPSLKGSRECFMLVSVPLMVIALLGVVGAIVSMTISPSSSSGDPIGATAQDQIFAPSLTPSNHPSLIITQPPSSSQIPSASPIKVPPTSKDSPESKPPYSNSIGASPTSSPSESFSPTVTSSSSPTSTPSATPSFTPTFFPTHKPTRIPTMSPTPKPTSSPTPRPTQSPTEHPTPNPTRFPTRNPTQAPTVSPTRRPTQKPTRNPTNVPSQNPTVAPTTSSPTTAPTEYPSATPTNAPTDELRIPELIELLSPMFPDMPSSANQQRALEWLSDATSQLGTVEPLTSTMQRFVLAVLYYSTNGDDDWISKAHWMDIEFSVCDWQFVDCARDGVITGLRSYTNGLTGSLPTELARLTAMTVLELDLNAVTGSIPTEFGRLTALEVLWLNSNSLTGTIPTELGELHELDELWLHSNNLAGEIPDDLADFLDNVDLCYMGDNWELDGIPSDCDELP